MNDHDRSPRHDPQRRAVGREADAPADEERSSLDDGRDGEREPASAYRDEVAPETGPATLEPPAAGDDQPSA